MNAQSTILAPNTGKFTPKTKTQKVYVEAWELLAQAKIHAIKGTRYEIIDEVRKHFRRVVKYQFNKLASEFASYLQYYYFNVRGDKVRGKKYSLLRERYNELAYLENIVEGKFAEITFKLNNTRNPSQEIRKELDAVCENFKTYLSYDSHQIRIYTYLLLNEQAHFNRDFDEIIRLSKTIITELESQKIERAFIFYKDLTIAFIVRGRYEEARSTIKKAVRNVSKGSYSWSIYVYYQFILEIYSKDYQAAYRVFKQAESKRQINKAMHEQWLIVRAYVQFLIQTGHLEGSTHFKFGKFFNEVPVFSADKEGNNINILILKILLSIGKQNGKIIDQREAIEKYIERYLRHNKRARIFLKMLLQIPIGHFNKTTILYRTKKMWKELQTNPYSPGQNFELEIIPYEVLWEEVLSLLDKQN
ncbi:MAG: hypothetical protein AAGD05_18780, partial [Bacteroidota bacterium]